METNWSSDVKIGKVGEKELQEVIWVKEENPIIKLNINSSINHSHNSNARKGASGGEIVLLIVVMVSVIVFLVD